MGNKCGGPLTEDCLGDSDPRYDEDASNNLEDQNKLWTLQKGFFKGGWNRYVATTDPPTPDARGFITSYENVTVQGTRFYRNVYSVYGNVTNPNTTGTLYVRDYFGHSSYEKDGSALTPLTQAYNFNRDSLFSLTLTESSYYPVGNNTLFSSQFVDGAVILDSRTCLDADCNSSSTFSEEYFQTPQGLLRTSFAVGFFTRVDSEEDWLQDLQVDYDQYNIPEDLSPLPMETACLVPQGECFNDQDFCDSGDPSCSDSPYKEPDAKVKPGVIAGFTIAGVVLAAVAALLIFRSVLRRQAKSNRIKFARCVADDMSIKKSARSLTPDLLEKEFNKIDNENGGRISREAMWEFLNSGKAGEINERDFRALWNVLDADKTGSVDFLEFCAFLAKCHDEYNKAARANRGSIAVAASLARISVARSVSVKMTESMVDVQEEEGGDPKTEET